ncbi:MAG: hypothetical protein RL701_1102 [Pseudomonadota bacterium]|jgi:hypothetical protein
MGFGRNPHVTKAQAAEQKARDASDAIARVAAWREAARLWDRAAEREDNDKRRQEYSEKAEAARTAADGGDPDGAEEDEEPAAGAEASEATARSESESSDEPAATRNPRLLN